MHARGVSPQSSYFLMPGSEGGIMLSGAARLRAGCKGLQKRNLTISVRCITLRSRRCPGFGDGALSNRSEPRRKCALRFYAAYVYLSDIWLNCHTKRQANTEYSA